jgi:hypothetical protein
MPFNKHFFQQFKEEIAEDHTAFKTHQEQKEVVSTQCDHKGKVKAIPGGLRCTCGAGWQGGQLDILLKHFTKGV